MMGQTYNELFDEFRSAGARMSRANGKVQRGTFLDSRMPFTPDHLKELADIAGFNESWLDVVH